MKHQSSNAFTEGSYEHGPYQIIEWKDTENTGAEGWIVIDRLINGVSGGGLFMHPKGTLLEVQDLAKTMSLKNGLQDPVFGGGKGGIKFDHKDPRAEGVLRRFLIANKEVIRTKWCTGADLNTSNEVIHRIIREDLNLDSGFACLGTMLYNKYGIESRAESMLDKIAEPANDYFRLAESATGFSVATCLEYLADGMPRIMIQGFGAVGKSLAYYIQTRKLGIIVGISDVDGFIANEDGIDAIELLNNYQKLAKNNNGSICFSSLLNEELKKKYTWTSNDQNDDAEVYLQKFLNSIKCDVFCPCAARYIITGHVLNTLLYESFTDAKQPVIVCGANNVFSSAEIMARAKASNILFVPEWLSNCGNALLFMESMKTNDEGSVWVESLFASIENRIYDVLDMATFEKTKEQEVHLYDKCHTIISNKLDQLEKGASKELVYV